MILTLLVACGVTNAQTAAAPTKLSELSSQLIETAQQYKTSSSELLSIQEDAIQKATTDLAQLRELVADGLVAKSELETSEQALATLHAQMEATRKQISDSDHMIAEIRGAQELAKTQTAIASKSHVKMVSKQYSPFSTTATILRYGGAAPWAIGGLAGIQSFFLTTFGRALPASAIGQSPTHNRLGYDHRNAVDVALHPDSAEGKSLIKYLQSQGIPFLAFRGAVPGVATGPHIHIGRPSHRLW